MLFTGIKNCDDILVLQTARCLCFAKKPRTGVNQIFAIELFAQCHGLDGNNTANLWIFTQVHHPHRAFAKFLLNLVTPQHRLFNRAAVKKHDSPGARTTAAKHDGLGQGPGPIKLGLDIFVVCVMGRHVLVHRFCLVELAFALKIKRQAVQVAHDRLVHRNPAKAVKRHVKLALAL